MASEDTAVLQEAGDSIDIATFEQILEMDDDDDREFSRGIVAGFLEQAEATFTQMDTALQKKELTELSSLGHFLKGSSATVGLTQMKNSCEKIQHLGTGKDEAGDKDQADDKCLAAIKTEVAKLRKEYTLVEKVLKKFYGDTL